MRLRSRSAPRSSPPGSRQLLLKGASIARWLYDSAGERVYDDVDLLVRDSQLAQAERTLQGRAFRFVHDDDHGQVWLRGPVNVDLHRRLTGIKAQIRTRFSSGCSRIPNGSSFRAGGCAC